MCVCVCMRAENKKFTSCRHEHARALAHVYTCTISTCVVRCKINFTYIMRHSNDNLTASVFILLFFFSLFFTGSIGNRICSNHVYCWLEIAASYGNNIIKYVEQYQQFLCFLNAGNECTLGTEKVTLMKIENNFAHKKIQYRIGRVLRNANEKRKKNNGNLTARGLIIS